MPPRRTRRFIGSPAHPRSTIRWGFRGCAILRAGIAQGSGSASVHAAGYFSGAIRDRPVPVCPKNALGILGGQVMAVSVFLAGPDRVHVGFIVDTMFWCLSGFEVDMYRRSALTDAPAADGSLRRPPLRPPVRRRPRESDHARVPARSRRRSAAAARSCDARR
jgi:hypothetical protein